MTIRTKIVGISAHRLEPSAENPEEVLFANLWAEENGKELKVLRYLLDPSGKGLSHQTSYRDAVVAATVVQWLGSPVGRQFLEKAGYHKTPPRCSSKSGGIQCERSHRHIGPHGATIGTGYGQWSRST